MRSGLLLFLFSQVILVASLSRTDKCEWNKTLETDAVSFVTSPGFPWTYRPSQDCTWVITAPKPDQRILVVFNPLFHLYDTDCKHDYVEIYDGGDELSPTIGKFCGRVVPPKFISSGNQLLIKFVTDNEDNGSGFSMKLEGYKTFECSRNFTAPQGVITTPFFPEKYPNYMNCTLTIFAPNMSDIVLEFDRFNMEGNPWQKPVPVCPHDWLDIWDGLPEVGIFIGRYCGKTSPDQVIAYSGILSMTITTDDATAEEGFSANYTIRDKRHSLVDEDAVDKCGGNISLKTDRVNYLTSPGYPLEYLPSQQCIWVIKAPELVQKIRINFNPFFHLEGTGCNHDYVEVYDGGDELSPTLGKFCGVAAPPQITSSSNQLLIKFVTDDENQGFGFSVGYEVFMTGPDCSRNFTAPQGVIETPGFPKKYPNNLDCTFMILASNTSVIEVEFKSFNMQADPTALQGVLCRLDRLDIWDGLPKVGRHLGRYCGQEFPHRVTSHSGILSMTVITDNRVSKEGFSANYAIRKKSLLPDHKRK
ncbi:neuropilin-1a [Lates calcarifer]|uniref:Neuropilin-1a n=2 Tax=Lates calcarifer TaxID=8187 RepID=A0AAJ7PP89_LATCA|nr:neuropilin-1a [Lates calcarifer]